MKTKNRTYEINKDEIQTLFGTITDNNPQMYKDGLLYRSGFYIEKTFCPQNVPVLCLDNIGQGNTSFFMKLYDLEDLHKVLSVTQKNKLNITIHHKIYYGKLRYFLDRPKEDEFTQEMEDMIEKIKDLGIQRKNIEIQNLRIRSEYHKLLYKHEEGVGVVIIGHGISDGFFSDDLSYYWSLDYKIPETLKLNVKTGTRLEKLIHEKL